MIEMSSSQQNHLKANEESSKFRDVRMWNDKFIQIVGWFLLTAGLCIIITVFYLAIRYQNVENNKRTLYDELTNSKSIEDSFSSIEYDTYDDSEKYSLRKLSFLSDATITDNIAANCYERSCRFICANNNKDIYEDLANAMDGSSCGTVTSLLLTNQNSSLHNKWINKNFTILAIMLTDSIYSRLQSAAFNSPMFTDVIFMSWTKVKFEYLGSGSLLGLYSLRKLVIDSHLPKTSLAFLQPVQTTLTHLQLNAGLSFNTSWSLFQSIHFGKLLHLDLSRNIIQGPVTKGMFASTPKVTYLFLKNCLITSIESDAFEHIGQNLRVLNLANNLLSTISDILVLQLGAMGTPMLLQLEPNNWRCDCNLLPLIEFYKENKKQFMSAPYCRFPNNLIGKYFDELVESEDMECDEQTSTTTAMTAASFALDLNSEIAETMIYSKEMGTETTPFSPTVQLSCLEAVELNPNESSSTESSFKADTRAFSYTSNHFIFEPPTYDLNLELLSNYSVRASITDFKDSDELNIIWFTDYFESEDHSSETVQLDYNCMNYEDPYLIIDSLRQNYTYTFCMMFRDKAVVSPLNCQPLYVPVIRTEDESDNVVWITESDKQFTIAMLCLIFAMSMFIGAVVAYMGIKAYPDILEGSKNVFVIKDYDKTCYVSTITESEYISSSLKKSCSFPSDSYKSHTSVNQKPKVVSRLTSEKSSSTYFEEAFSNLTFPNGDEYELPTQFHFATSERCESNAYTKSPGSPPPLPKRNSNISLIYNHKENKYVDEQ